MPDGRWWSRDSQTRWLTFVVLLGVFFSTRGYRSREGDQAYRLPILMHQQAPEVYADDPFVRSFDRFNPHRGALGVIGLASRPFGLSAGLAALFAATFFATCVGVDRLARGVWSEQEAGTGVGVGVIAAILVLIAQGGNVGTNHLFEPILLDRLLAFAMGWLAIGATLCERRQGEIEAGLWLGTAALIHPSVGLQLAMLVGVSRVVQWAMGPKNWEEGKVTIVAVGWLIVAVLPGLGLNLRGSGELTEGLDPATIRLLSAELQSPQHMLPHLWHSAQWWAWGCYPILACLALTDGEGLGRVRARRGLVRLIGVNLAGLALAWWGIEWLGNLRLTLFQPFRMATVARGLCLVAVAGHVQRLWSGEDVSLGRTRAVLLGVGLLGDRSLVVVSAFEVVCTIADRVGGRGKVVGRVLGWTVLGWGIFQLSRHDTESGHVPILAALVGMLAATGVGRARMWSWSWKRRRVAAGLVLAWAAPVLAMGANLVERERFFLGSSAWRVLVKRCRFVEAPLDDVEALGLWAREHTPREARFVGPPGPKGFRLWSSRSLAFNRSGSPYQAAGLADWARRFQDHVGMSGPPEGLVGAYLRDRHGLEGRYQGMSHAERAALAVRQGAGYVLAAAPRPGERTEGLEVLRVEGRYALYKVTEASPAEVASVSKPRR